VRESRGVRCVGAAGAKAPAWYASPNLPAVDLAVPDMRPCEHTGLCMRTAAGAPAINVPHEHDGDIVRHVMGIQLPQVSTHHQKARRQIDTQCAIPLCQGHVLQVWPVLLAAEAAAASVHVLVFAGACV
jgi:hypothetical protein